MTLQPNADRSSSGAPYTADWRLNMYTHIARLTIAAVLAAELAAAQTPARFDYTIRADFFAGVVGDQARLSRAMAACEDILSRNPREPEALVWHGSGLLVQSRTAFQAGDLARGQEMFDRGLKEMNEAVGLAPDNVAVVIPRGSVLLQVSRFVPAPMATSLIEQGVADYEKALAIQTPYFSTLGDHPRSELLFGLAEGYSRLGQPDKARPYFARIIEEVPKSGQAPRAAEWLATGSLPKLSGMTCVGCHQPDARK
jgi:tetratricopeptide (TPR) repeat protein